MYTCVREHLLVNTSLYQYTGMLRPLGSRVSCDCAKNKNLCVKVVIKDLILSITGPENQRNGVKAIVQLHADM